MIMDCRTVELDFKIISTQDPPPLLLIVLIMHFNFSFCFLIQASSLFMKATKPFKTRWPGFFLRLHEIQSSAAAAAAYTWLVSVMVPDYNQEEKSPFSQFNTTPIMCWSGLLNYPWINLLQQRGIESKMGNCPCFTHNLSLRETTKIIF